MRSKRQVLRLVVDTNIFVSALFSMARGRKSIERTLFELIAYGPHAPTLIVSPPILDEYQDVFHRSKFKFGTHAELALDAILRLGEAVRPSVQIQQLRDPDDTKFVAAALDGRAHYLLTHNTRDFPDWTFHRDRQRVFSARVSGAARQVHNVTPISELSEMTLSRLYGGGVLLLLAALAACDQPPPPVEMPYAPPPPRPEAKGLDTPIGTMSIPAMNPMTPEKVALGKLLFFERRLSKNGKMSCGTCHVPENGWTDGKQFSTKFDGQPNERNTPTLYNVGFYKQLSWEGRELSLENQIRSEWQQQMGADLEEATSAINEIAAYRSVFERARGHKGTAADIADALASFVRTIRADRSVWDQYKRGEKDAVSEEVRLGYEVFIRPDKGNCAACHPAKLYTDAVFEKGKVDGTLATFKTPSLRALTQTRPYFHDGSARTLDDAVTVMLEGGFGTNVSRDIAQKQRTITKQEKAALIRFLQALSPPIDSADKPRSR